MKTCTKCGKSKPKSCFSKGTANKDGLYCYCKDCDKVRAKKYRDEHPEIRERGRRKQTEYRKTARGKANIKKNRMKHRYNITLEEYDQKLEEQNGVCAICGVNRTTRNKYGENRLCIDHVHKTGKVRGLLCLNCNFIVGYAKDSKETLLQAALYLEQHSD